jgi:O-antigen ligase
VLMALLLASLMRGPGPARSHDRRDLALYRGARASALAFLIGASLSGGSADPGILFFLCLAVVTAARRQAASLRLPTAARSDLSIAAPYRPAGAR